MGRKYLEAEGVAMERAGAGLETAASATAGTLWVAAAALPQVAAYRAADSGRSAILRYDLRSGGLVRRYEPRGAEAHAIGDLIVTRGGDVFATDSRAPVAYRIAAGTDTLERFVQSPLLLSAQGLALTPDERYLCVADYARGILRVDLTTAASP